MSLYTGSYTEDVDGDGVRLNAFEHEDASIAYDPLSANRRFAGAADLAVLGTLVFAGATRHSISVMVPDCLLPPENNTGRERTMEMLMDFHALHRRRVGSAHDRTARRPL